MAPKCRCYWDLFQKGKMLEDPVVTLKGDLSRDWTQASTGSPEGISSPRRGEERWQFCSKKSNN